VIGRANFTKMFTAACNFLTSDKFYCECLSAIKCRIRLNDEDHDIVVRLLESQLASAISVFGLIGALYDRCHRPVAGTTMSDA